MELKEFIKTAITDITEAVSELQAELDNGAIVNPTLPHPVGNGSVDAGMGNQQIQKLEFDVALTIAETSSIDGGAKGGIAVFSAKMGSLQQAQSQNVSRLSFTVPVALPASFIKPAEEMALDTRQRSLRTHIAMIDS